jgi:transcriptional regulator with XRE-family HTH domain
MDFAANVLAAETDAEQSSDPIPGLFKPVRDCDYQAAVSRVILEIRAEYGYKSAEALADKVGCSKSTILNGENGTGNLDAVTLLNLAMFHGGEARLKRVIGLINGCPPKQLTPFERIARANREIASALHAAESAHA